MNRLESAAFDAILDPDSVPTSPESKIIAHMAARKNSDVLATLQRYAAAAERSYHKNHRELLHTRQVAQKMYQKAMDNYIKNVVHAPMPGASLPVQKLPKQNGFASQQPASTIHKAPSAACAAHDPLC